MTLLMLFVLDGGGDGGDDDDGDFDDHVKDDFPFDDDHVGVVDARRVWCLCQYLNCSHSIAV